MYGRSLEDLGSVQTEHVDIEIELISTYLRTIIEMPSTSNMVRGKIRPFLTDYMEQVYHQIRKINGASLIGLFKRSSVDRPLYCMVTTELSVDPACRFLAMSLVCLFFPFVRINTACDADPCARASSKPAWRNGQMHHRIWL